MKGSIFKTAMNLFVDLDPKLSNEQNLQKIISVYKNELKCEAVIFLDQYHDNEERLLHLKSAISQFHNSEFYKDLESGAYAKEKMVYDNFKDHHYYAFQLTGFGWLVLINEYLIPQTLIQNFPKPINYITNELLLARKSKFNEGLMNRINVQNELVNEILSGIIIFNMDGSLFYLNQIAKKWAGINNESFSEYKIADVKEFFSYNIEKSWTELTKELKQVDDLSVGGSVKNIKNNKETLTEISLKYFSINNKEFIIANLIDNTEELKSKKKLSDEIELQDLLLNIASKYLNIHYSKIEETIKQSLGELGTFVDADRVYIFDYDFKNETCSNTFEWCAAGISSEKDNLQNVPIKFFPEWVEKHQNKEPFIVDSIENLPDTGEQGLKAILSAQHIKSLVTFPIAEEEDLLGFVGFDSVYKYKRYSEREIKLLSLFSLMLANIQIRKQWVNNFIAQRNRYISIINDINIGLIEVDNELNILFVNDHICKLLGYQEEELKNLNCPKAFLDDESKLLFYNKLHAINDGENITMELYLYNKQKKRKPVLLSMCQIESKHNNTKGYLCASIDLTQQKNIETDLIKAKEKAEVASKAKETFLANISHEMRTPLHIINGVISEVLKTRLNEEQSYLMLRGNLSSKHLLNLVNNVLDMAKINSDEIYLDYRDHDLYDTTRDVFEMLKPLADDNQINFNVHFNLEEDVQYRFDAQKLNQVLINLISNAIKFTKQGSVDFYIEVINDFDAYSIVNFRVKDTGIGMTEEFQKKLFEKYKREKDFRNISKSGTGLGMPISKKLVKLMGGDITVKSQKNKGSEFSFSLKLKKTKVQKANLEQDKSFGNIPDKNILVVEDNLMSQVLIKKKLNRLGANISLCNDGLEAIELLKRNRFDIILLDMQMPNLDGLGTAKIIRENLRLKTPLIIITANVFSKDIDKFKTYDIESFVLKPFKDEVLFSTISRAFDKEPSTSLSLKISSNNNKKLYSIERLLERVDGDTEFLNELIETFHYILKDTLAQMKRYIDLKNREALLKLLHKIKPSLIDLGVKSVVNKIISIEKSHINSFDEAEESFTEIFKLLETLYSQIKDFEKSEPNLP